MLKKLEKIFDQSWKKKEEDRKVKATQYKKLAPNALRFTYYLKSCKSHEKNETKNIRLLVFSFSSINLAF